MTAHPILQVWHHQVLRIIRLGSPVDTLLGLAAKGGALIGTILFAFAFLVLLPVVTRETIVADGLSAFLSDYLFTLLVVTLLLNTWAFTSAGTDLRTYRSYPVSMAWLAAVMIVVRALHVRYLAMGLAVLITLALVMPTVGMRAVAMIGLHILVLDSCCILLRILLTRHTWMVYLLIAPLAVAAMIDFSGGRNLSARAFEAWTSSSAGTSGSLVTLTMVTCALMALSHQHIQSLLRYGR